MTLLIRAISDTDADADADFVDFAEIRHRRVRDSVLGRSHKLIRIRHGDNRRAF